MLRFHCQTAGCTLQAEETTVNVARVTMQALAAALGGTQSLHTNSSDEALSLPSEEAARVALRTQQVLAAENGVCDTVDPLGGSYYVESLTREIEERVREYLEEIDRRGGVLACIESRYIKDEIERSAYSYQKGLESGTIKVAGLNYPPGTGGGGGGGGLGGRHAGGERSGESGRDETGAEGLGGKHHEGERGAEKHGGGSDVSRSVFALRPEIEREQP